MTRNSVELLAPAGNIVSLHAAIQAGADAVYLGVETFNARRGADNFTLETLKDACDYAHLRKRKVYLTLNVIVFPSETQEALETARQAYRAGVDALIIQDIGLATEIHRILPQLPLHISTQMNTHTSDGIEAAKKLGAKRVTLARELSLSEISTLSGIADQNEMELEVFAHGALCVSYSGQCFMSSMIGGRSANRGLCAQACRLPYTLHNKSLKKNLNSPGDHLLSPKDLSTIDILPALIESGVSSLKLEGRMKSPEYVYAVTSIYRKALDKAQHAAEEYSVSPEDRQALEEVFSRGFTTAYTQGKRDNSIMSFKRPNNRGVLVGRVDQVKDSTVCFKPSMELEVGDVLEFWTKKGNFTHTLDSLDFDRDATLRLTVVQSVKKGDRVFRVRKNALSFRDDSFSPRIPIVGTIALHIGKPLAISFETHDSISATVEGTIVEQARTKSVTKQEIEEHVDRLGNTSFVLEDLSIDLEEEVGIGFSALHKIRTRALKQLQEEMLADYRKRSLVRVADREWPALYQPKKCEVVVWASNPACARAAKRAGADRIFVPALSYKRGEASIGGQLSQTAEQAGYPKQSIIALPEVEHDALGDTREAALDFNSWRYVKQGKPVVVENLGQLYRASQVGALPEIGPHLPVTNKLSLASAHEWGARRVWLSPELNLAQIKTLAEQSPLPLGLTVIGHQKLMTTEHCLLMSQGDCAENCDTCARRKSPHYLKDRKGYEFPVLTDMYGRSHLYNAVLMDNAHAVADLVKAKISSLMVDTTLMNVEETTKAVQRAVRARDIAIGGDNHVAKKEDTTSGHLFRGVQ